MELLWLLVNGTFGPDRLRMWALQELNARGELKRQQTVEVFLHGKRCSTAFHATRLNPDFRFGKPLPEKWERRYAQIVEAGSGARPDWESIAASCFRILREVPDYYPARFNYAISLLNLGRMEDAEPVLRQLVTEQPEYLFARATLLQLFVRDNRMEESDALCHATEMPSETHPAAMVAWMVAQTFYHEKGARDQEAFECIRFAHDLAPESPSVANLWPAYADRE